MEDVHSITRWHLPRTLRLWHKQELLTIKMASADHALDLEETLEESKEHLISHFDWASLPQGYTDQDARLKILEKSQLLNEAYNFHLYKRSKLIGSFSIHSRLSEEGSEWEMGYWIHPEYLRQGYGTLALCSGLWLQREFLTGTVYLQVHTKNQRGLAFLARHNLRAESIATRTNLLGTDEEMAVFRPWGEKKPDYESSAVAYMIERWKLKLIEVEW